MVDESVVKDIFLHTNHETIDPTTCHYRVSGADMKSVDQEVKVSLTEILPFIG